MSFREGSVPPPGARALVLLLCLAFPALGLAVICPDASLVWTRTHDGGISADDWAAGVAVDSGGNVIVVGAENVAGQGRDWFIRKINFDGTDSWTAGYNNAVVNGDDQALAVTTDALDNIYVAGFETNNGKALGTNRNWMVRRYTSGGIPLVPTDLVTETVTSVVDEARGIAVASTGSIYVGGYIDDNDGTGKDWHIRRYSSGGGFDRAWMYDSPASDDDAINALAIDPFNDDFVYVGYDTRSDLNQGRDWLIRKRDGLTGALKWARVHDGPASADDEAHGVAVDPVSQNVYVAGSERVPGQGLNWMVRGFDVNGTLLWTVTANSPGNADEEALAVAADGSGNLVVAGYENRPDFGGGQSDNWVLRKYRADGSLVWSRSFNGAGNAGDRLLGVAADASSTVVAAGYEDRGDLGEGLNLHVKKWQNTGCMEPFVTFDPPDPSVGEWVDVYYTLSNTGGVDAINVTMAMEISSGVSLLTLVASPALTGTLFLATGSSTSYKWTYSVSGCGNVEFTATGTGEDELSGLPLMGVGSRIMPALCAAQLETVVQFVPNPSVMPASVGRWVEAHLTVSNTGEVAASGVSGTLYIVPGAPPGQVEVISGPVPLGPQFLLAGSCTTFVWTYSVSGAGNTRFTGTVTGTNVRTTAPLGDLTISWLNTKTAASLVATLTYDNPFATASVGQCASVTLTVQNVGEVAASLVVPSLTITGGAVSYANIAGTLMTGPKPAGPVNLDPGGTTQFVYSSTITGAATVTFPSCNGPVWAGNIDFSATASGIDSGTGRTISFTVTSSLTTVPAASLAGSLVIVPVKQTGTFWTELSPPPSVGQVIEVRYTVTNTGGNFAGPIIPDLEANVGGSLGMPLGGPDPATSPGLMGTCSTTFVWSFQLTGTGFVELTVTATGTDIGSLASLTASASASATITQASRFSATVFLPPVAAQVGQAISVTLFITNVGDVPAEIVYATMFISSGAGLVSWFLDPMSPSATSFSILPGVTTAYIWSVSVTGVGNVIFNPYVIWEDQNSGLLDWASDSAVLTIQGVTLLEGTLAVNPGASPVRETVELHLTVSNTGSSPATNVFPAAGFPRATVGASLVGPPGGPVPAAPVTLGPGQTVTFTWRYVGQSPGDVRFEADVSGLDSGGAPISLASLPSVWLEFLPVADILPYPNPFNPGKCVAPPCTLKFHNLKVDSVVGIYTISGLRVWEAVHIGLPIEWDGKNKDGEEVSPGIYLWLVEDGQGGQKGRVIVRR